MKKFFCYHCQQDIIPFKLWKWHFCRQCFRPVSDDSGLYLICNRCGANMPADAHNCPRCGYGVNGYPSQDIHLLSSQSNWIELVIRAVLLFFSAFLAFWILYFSVYLIGIFFFFGLAYYIYNLLTEMRR